LHSCDLNSGDPTIFGNFKVPQVAVNEVINQVQSYKANGYPPSTGFEHARQAIAKKFGSPEAPLTSKVG
jgi:tyrosine aminotransferase